MSHFVSHQQGYDTFIYYKGAGYKCKTYIPTERQKEWRRIYDANELQIKSGESFSDKKTFDAIEQEVAFDEVLKGLFADGLFVILSLIGLILLWLNRKKISKERQEGRLRLLSWLFILTALYCHWYIMQFVFEVIETSMGLPPDFTPWINWLADHFHISGWFFLSFNCLIGLLVLSYITFRIVPRCQLIPFLVSGLAGGILSRLMWYSWLGPIVMPHP